MVELYKRKQTKRDKKEMIQIERVNEIDTKEKERVGEKECGVCVCVCVWCVSPTECRERESLNCVHVICRKISFDNEIGTNEFQG